MIEHDVILPPRALQHVMQFFTWPPSFWINEQLIGSIIYVLLSKHNTNKNVKIHESIKRGYIVANNSIKSYLN